MLTDFFTKNLDIVFLIYGAAFIIMGIAILSQTGRGSTFRISNVIWLLAAFGLSHGLNEWLDMLAIIRWSNSNLFSLVRLSMLTISYVFLFEFGRRLISLCCKKFLNAWVTVIVSSIAVILMFSLGQGRNIWPRYFLGFPGAFLSAIGFVSYYRCGEDIMRQTSFQRYFIIVALFLGIYGILGGIVVPKANFFPASIINYNSFLSLFGIPVQVFRSACAIGISYSVWKFLSIFNWEYRQKLLNEISERKRTEEQLRLANKQLDKATRAKSEFLANMSHELRTPLNSIIGFSEVLQDEKIGQLTEKQAKYITNVLTSGRHLLGLINDLLDISKVESGKMELLLNEFSFPQLINSINTILKELAFKKKIAINTHIVPEISVINADETKVKQIMYNLLSNAIKFTPDGGKVDIQADIKDEQLRVSVTDTGIGIKPEDMDKLFKTFQQIDSEYTQKYGGTGLGLALTKKLVELHGGKIWAESEFGKRSTFTFTIPLRRK